MLEKPVAVQRASDESRIYTVVIPHGSSSSAAEYRTRTSKI
jgi:hypothetical protein